MFTYSVDMLISGASKQISLVLPMFYDFAQTDLINYFSSSARYIVSTRHLLRAALYESWQGVTDVAHLIIVNLAKFQLLSYTWRLLFGTK